MKPKTPDLVLDEIARDNFSKIIDLAPQIRARVVKEQKARMKSTTRYLIAAAAVGLLITLIFVSVPDVTQAMNRLLGYLSSVGLVEQSAPLRVLPEPVKAIQNGITITVEQAVLDGEHSVILFQVENLTVPENPCEARCSQLPSLRLPDGKELKGDGSGSGWALGYNRRLTYPPIPAGVNDAELVFPCLQQTTRNAAPQNWSIPLHFIPIPPEKTVYPLLDLPTPTSVPTQLATQEPQDKRITPADISLSFNHFVPLKEGFILYGAFQPASESILVDWIDSSALHLLDASGKEIILEEDTTAEKAPRGYGQPFSMAYRTSGLSTSGPVRFTVDSVWVDQKVDASFVFDPGPNPHPGQTWQLDKEVKVAGHILRVASATLGASGKGLSFIFDPNSEIQYAVLTAFDQPLSGGTGGQGSSGFTFSAGLPDEPIRVSVTSITYSLNGPWQTTLDLPVTATAAAPTPQSAAVCLTPASWKKPAANGPAALPKGLTGKLAVSFQTETDFNYQVMVTNLDGSDQQIIGYGDWPALSPDNSTLVYTGQQGLVMVDLATNQSMPVSGTTISDRGAIWSPDGKQIAFTRGPASGLIGAPGPYSIWVVSSSGTDLHQVSSGSDANHAMAWLPGSQRILFTKENPSGAFVLVLNLQTGEVEPLFEVNYASSSLSISPDGKQVAFEEMLPGDRYAIFVSDLNGSNRRLLVDTSPVIATHPLWSPDGRWLAASFWDPATDTHPAILALVQVDTCQFLPLPNLSSYGYTWNP